MGKRYHIDINGVPVECKANKRPCPRGGGHFGSYQEAQKRADYLNSFEPKFNGDAPMLFKDRPMPKLDYKDISLSDEEMEKLYPEKSYRYLGGSYYAGKRAKENLPNKEVAKEVKKELKDLYRECPELKFSAKSDTYSVTVTVDGLGWRDLYDLDKPSLTYIDRPYSKTAEDVIKTAHAKMDEFNYDFSNMQVDYSNTGFYDFVNITTPSDNAWRKSAKTRTKLEKALKDKDKDEASKQFEQYKNDYKDTVYQDCVSQVLNDATNEVKTWDNVKEKADELFEQREPQMNKIFDNFNEKIKSM